MAKIKKWFRLDNSAKIYPMLMNKQNQNLFSLTCELVDDVDETMLQRAIEITLPRFPSMSVRLMRGFFWYYFEQNYSTPQVMATPDMIMKKITFNNCNGYNFRLSYFKNKITIDFFHVITDGTGGMHFLKSIVYSYLNLMGADIESECKILTLASPVKLEELEDSFLTNYKPLKLKDLKINSFKSNTAFKINGIPFKDNGKGVIQATLPASALHKICKAKGCTITEFLGGLFMYSIYITKGRGLTDHAYLQLLVPINLRKAFNSVTLRNFSLFSKVCKDIAVPDLTLDDFIIELSSSLKRDTDKELLQNKICTTISAEKFLIMRILPLFVKQLIFKVANSIFGKSKKTATFSNLGVVDVPESMRNHVKSFSFLLGVNRVNPINLAVGTTFDTMVLSFVRTITDTDIETFFIKHLASLGLDISVCSNFWEVEYAL